ncbi:MAG: sensor hybrid histidine kinase [Gammaproteobacteria bacterium]|nr:sensor hybrid histidine kinase [Gammaproteobacteria bacterium]
MTTIHDIDPGSREHELESLLRRTQLACDVLARRKDELDSVLAAGRLGFCRIAGKTREVLTTNSQFKAEFGWPPDAQISWQELEKRVQRDDRPKLADAVDAAFTSGAEVDIIVRTQWPTSGKQWVTIRGRPVSSDDALETDLILTSRNVSAERRAAVGKQRERASLLEQERKLREAAEAANRAKDEFLSVISHELRSPLNAILGWNRILTLKRREDPEVASITPRIEQSAKAQLKMVNDLLDLGRVGTGKLKIEARPAQLAKVVSLALDLARPTAAARGIEIVADLAPGAGQLRGDPDRLQQVVANLLSNAVKFTSPGGRITVTLRDVAAFTELAIADTGQGIAPELLPHVFDRFRQGDSSSTRHSGGLGLGLTLVREIVALHGGSVAANSEGVGAGAVFLVRLPTTHGWPAADKAASGGSERGSTLRSLDGLSILVVDDEMDARTVVAETLRLEGARVTVTDSACSAFQHLQAVGAHFDILVTDIGMPEEDGYSLVRKVRALQIGRHMLAIAVTGYASKGDVAAAIEAGFDVHVPKPVDFDTFVPMVRRLAALTRSEASPRV